jgi:isoleucyl-tRNA synthetase
MTDTQKTNADFYKETVFLPKTDFPMRGGLPQKEPEIMAKWDDIDLYNKIRTQSQSKPKYILHDGPPYANGHIHIGHAMNKILKDVVVRSFQMMGYNAPYIPGWDCHGLPIEWKIEEQYRNKDQNKDDVEILDFRSECRNFAQKWVDIQIEEFQRLGITGDWDNPYLTMTKSAEANIVREIHKVLKSGKLYRGAKPIMWSVVEKTALAEAEVEYKEHKSITVWIKFPVRQSPVKELEGAHIVIWTTTPWTLPSNRATAYGEDIEYGLYEIEELAENSRAKVGDKIVIATALAEQVKADAKITSLKSIKTFKGAELAGTMCDHPLKDKGYDFDVPSLPADFVTTEAGTGFVHIAPSHGADDFDLGKANKLEITDNVNDDGTFKDHVPLFAGMEVYTPKGELGGGNFAVLKAMDEADALMAKGSMRHEYPHSWRSKAPLIFRTTPQWFIGMDEIENQTGDTLRDVALKEIEKTNWVPEQGENRIRSMVEGRPDWCISRQRSWGVPIALFVHKTTGEILDDDNVHNRIGYIFEEEGSDAWWEKPASAFLGNEYEADDYEQIFDIVDVWFESGSTHAFVVGQREELNQIPVDLYLEGSDQHRGWFQSSLLESCITNGHAPFKNVLTHGFVLDEKGYKMSKSAGNVTDPLKVIKQSGADILRLWTLTSDYSDDIRISQDSIKSASDLYRRLRNTLRFLLGSLEGLTKDELIDESEYKDMPELERLALHKLYTMDKTIRSHTENFEFMKLTKALHEFCNQDLSSLYFDIRKDRLYCDRPDSFERRATRTVLYHIYNSLVTWIAPLLAFTAEEAWSHRPAGIFDDAESIHLRTYPQVPESWKNEELAQKWEKIIEVRHAVLLAIEPHRQDKTIGSSLEAHPVIAVNDEYRTALEGQDMAEICITSLATVKSAEGDENITITFQKAEGNKCLRCWKILPEVGTDHDYPDLTLRDADAVRWYKQNAKAA